MCQSLPKALHIFAVLDWLEILKVLTGISTAIIAGLALQNWKRQSKAEKKTAFVSELTDAIHEFIALIREPLEMIRLIKGMFSIHAGLPGLDKSLKHPELVAFIEKDGKYAAQQLFELLKPCTPVLSKIASLVAKGQILGFEGYSEYHNVLKQLDQQHVRIHKFSFLIGRTSMIWQNPKVEESLDYLLSIDPEEMNEHIQKQNIKFIELAKTSYEAAYTSKKPKRWWAINMMAVVSAWRQ